MADCHSIKSTKWVGCLLLWLGLVWSLAPAAFAQDSMPEFEVDAFSQRGETLSVETQLELYTRIPYTQLTFINTPDGFTARYGVMVEVVELDEDARRQNVVTTRIWEGKVGVDTYAATQSDNYYDFTTQSIPLMAGHYMLDFQVEDKESSEVFVREIPVTVRDLNKPVAVSDVSLLASFDAEQNTMVPSVANRIGTDERGLKIFYEVYTEQKRPVQISHEVVWLQKEVGLQSVQLTYQRNRTDLEDGEVIYTEAEGTRLEGKRNQHVVTIPMDDMKVGTYMVRVKVKDEEGSLLDVAEKTFVAQWTGLNEHIRELDKAIAQLAYIAKKKDLRHIIEASNDTDRYQRFMAFWEKRDPTPSTRRNERMEEYYYRVASANDRYGTVEDGWETDRGYVMVRFGEPDMVERHPYSFNTKPYEIWTYYRIGRQFIFIDQTGLGDYELLVPIWDERTRIR